MDNNIIIEVKDVGKKYSISHERGKYVALRDVITNMIKAPWTFMTRKMKQAIGMEKEEFWALKDLNFTIDRGEVVGIIGHNGAGKSTLLKILSQITPPTTGEIKIYGRVNSLLEVGTGFHPELSGRENIFLNGAILGMTRREIARKFNEIVAFAGTEQFLDTPVKHYSSGMYVRLAFSVAAHMEPDILIVDEVLAVGDTEFQKKCLKKMEEVTHDNGRTILFVSHNLSAIKTLCPKTILLQKGKIVFYGPTDEAIRIYNKDKDEAANTEWKGNEGDDNAKLTHTWVKSADQVEGFHTGAEIEIGVELDIKKTIPGLILGFSLWSDYDYPLAIKFYDDDVSSGPVTVEPGKFTKKFYIPKDTLSLGTYRICFHVGIFKTKDIIGMIGRRTPEGELSFDLTNVDGLGASSHPVKAYGQASLFRPDWDVK